MHSTERPGPILAPTVRGLQGRLHPGLLHPHFLFLHNFSRKSISSPHQQTRSEGCGIGSYKNDGDLRKAFDMVVYRDAVSSIRSAIPKIMSRCGSLASFGCGGIGTKTLFGCQTSWHSTT